MLALVNMWTEHQCMLKTLLYHLIKMKLLRGVQTFMSVDVTHVIRDLYTTQVDGKLEISDAS